MPPDDPEQTPPAARAPRRRQPIVTIAVIAPAVASFLGSLLAPPENWVEWNRLGRFSAEQVWDGAWWAYLTTIFPHGNLLHIGFNTLWVWELGRLIESSRPRWLLVLVVLLGAIVGSGLELLATGVMGIGLSGVVYALFGYVLGQQLGNRSYTIPPRLSAILIGWLLVCFPLTWLEVLPVANFAHLGGLLAGLALGCVWWRPVRQPWARPAGLVLGLLLLAAAILPAIHHPFSPRYDWWRGNRAFDQADYHAAIEWYDRALAKDPSLEGVRHNRELAERALAVETPLDPPETP